MSDSGPLRREVYYSGYVQGVGFRFTVQHIARRFAVEGFVRNVPDGRVQLVAEGEPHELDQFLRAVRDRMDVNIHDLTDDSQEASGKFVGFEIRY